MPIDLLKLTDLEWTCGDAFWIISGKKKRKEKNVEHTKLKTIEK